jgi:DNA recombination protein RmuC
MQEIIYLLVGLLVGALATWLVAKAQNSTAHQVTESKLNTAQAELIRLQDNLEKERKAHLEQTAQLAAAEANYNNLEDQLRSQQDLLAVQFRNLANDLLEEKSRRFTEQNRENLDQILQPLSEKIKAFEKKVEDTYREELRDKAGLLAEIQKLHSLSTRLSDDATSLTRALRGDTKKQGNWGEMILEKVLERSGLTAGVEYRTQVLTRNQAGELIKPDVVVYLPDSKHLVIDAKVSLVAYEQLMNAEENTDRDRYLLAHVASVKSHIRLLADKTYYSGDQLLSPDFTLLFMPIESAFSLAVQADADLFNFGWERRIVVVSPTTLLATLRTVASVWKMEKQSKNALEIARLSGEMYDKLEGFLQDMNKIGKQLKDAQDAHAAAMNKLTEGRGNVIRTAEKIKQLGARATKDLPKNLLDQADE